MLDRLRSYERSLFHASSKPLGRGSFWARVVCATVFFSLINGLDIGFKDADIGHWIRLLPPREFEFGRLGGRERLRGAGFADAVCAGDLGALFVWSSVRLIDWLLIS
jgi:hypothetical protein